MRKTMDIKLVLCFLAALCATGYCEQPSPHCLARPDQGLCMGHMPRYYYEPNNNTCHEFIYGGCGGNHNNFMTENECERKCVTEGGVNPCLLRYEEGPCKAMIFRFYWDTETNKCGEFIYGGCQGNKNNFETVEECQDKCGENGSHPLSLPHVTVIVVSLLSVLLTSAL